jgi:hippurate hydrolase
LAKTGIVAVLNSDIKGKGIAFRSDIDALDLQEKNSFKHASKNGKMHACGHDGHIAMLLFALEFLANINKPKQKIYFIFQPAEENENGAGAMIEDGLFEKCEISEIYGLHNWPGLEMGKVAIKEGAVMASYDNFDITIKGKGSHAAYPHYGVDSVLVASRVVEALQSIISREIDPLNPAVLSITSIKGGQTYNIIPSEVELKGTARTFDTALQDKIESSIKRVLEGVCKANGAQFEFRYNRGYPPTINSYTKRALKALERFVEKDDIITDYPSSMGSEDFALYLQKVKGCYVKFGSKEGDDEKNLHSPYFDFNDNLLKIGAKFWIELANL